MVKPSIHYPYKAQTQARQWLYVSQILVGWSLYIDQIMSRQWPDSGHTPSSSSAPLAAAARRPAPVAPLHPRALAAARAAQPRRAAAANRYRVAAPAMSSPAWLPALGGPAFPPSRPAPARPLRLAPCAARPAAAPSRPPLPPRTALRPRLACTMLRFPPGPEWEPRFPPRLCVSELKPRRHPFYSAPSARPGFRLLRARADSSARRSWPLAGFGLPPATAAGASRPGRLPQPARRLQRSVPVPAAPPRVRGRLLASACRPRRVRL
ncbi:hypothetical protein VPH35_053977 [Triticum aestivum]